MNHNSAFSFIEDADIPGGGGRANKEPNVHSSWRSDISHGWLCAMNSVVQKGSWVSFSLVCPLHPYEWDTELASMKRGTSRGAAERERGRDCKRALFGLDWLILPITSPSPTPPPSRIKRNPERRGYAMTADTLSEETK